MPIRIICKECEAQHLALTRNCECGMNQDKCGSGLASLRRRSWMVDVSKECSCREKRNCGRRLIRMPEHRLLRRKASFERQAKYIDT